MAAPSRSYSRPAHKPGVGTNPYFTRDVDRLNTVRSVVHADNVAKKRICLLGDPHKGGHNEPVEEAAGGEDEEEDAIARSLWIVGE